jgi:hypothetical protein
MPMKRILPLVIFCCLVAACNRPMLQPPVTRTIPAKSAPDTGVALTETAPRLALESTQTSAAPHIAATSANPPTNTPEPSPTPYSTPAWCPVEYVTPNASGSLRVVYISQDNLWIWDEGGSAQQLTTSDDIHQVSLSDDGQIIAFTRNIDEYRQDLWAINADGSNEQRLVSADKLAELDGSQDALGFSPTGLQWEPGKHQLMFYTYPIFDGIWIFQPSTVWLVDTDTGDISAAPYQDGHISYSPDGKQVAIYNIDGLSLANLDGSNLRKNALPGYHGIGEGESYYHPWPHWSPDSSSLLVALPDKDEYYQNRATVSIWRLPVEGKPDIVGQWKAFSPSVSFSPDQRFIAYWPWPEGAANLRELHLSSLDTNSGEPLTDLVYIQGELLWNLDWSPDSLHFFIGLVGSHGQSQLYLGHVCQRPVLLSEFDLPGSFYPIWVDASRYLLAIGESTSDETLELRLEQIGQAEMETLGVVSAYDWVILP